MTEAPPIRERIRDYYGATPDARRQPSLATRRWVEEFHSFEAAAADLVTLCDTLLPRPTEPGPASVER